jgi:hypothetical protein
MIRGAGLAVIAVLMFAPTALAVPPSLISVTAPDRHPAATFAAPKAGDVTIYFSTKPDRASDGRFLSENVAETDFLTDDEIQSGKWTYERQIDPGTYYVMLNASPDFDQCYIFGSGTYDPACADGFSNVVQLVVPKPTTRYRATVEAFRFINVAHLSLTGAPLGEKRPYKVCYPNRTGRRVCVNGTLDGYDWGSSAQDDLRVSTRALRPITTFSWYVGTSLVARKTARLH